MNGLSPQTDLRVWALGIHTAWVAFIATLAVLTPTSSPGGLVGMFLVSLVDFPLSILGSGLARLLLGFRGGDTDLASLAAFWVFGGIQWGGIAWLVMWFKRRRRESGLCRKCGYDLRGSTEFGRCPECGTQFEPAKVAAPAGDSQPRRSGPARPVDGSCDEESS